MSSSKSEVCRNGLCKKVRILLGTNGTNTTLPRCRISQRLIAARAMTHIVARTGDTPKRRNKLGNIIGGGSDLGVLLRLHAIRISYNHEYLKVFFLFILLYFKGFITLVLS
jgi:hypothetical protein